jgi:ATP synthase subunit 6
MTDIPPPPTGQIGVPTNQNPSLKAPDYLFVGSENPIEWLKKHPVVKHEMLVKAATPQDHDTLIVKQTKQPFSFDMLLNKLGDHHELDIFFTETPILPIIFLDQNTKLTMYPNLHSMHDAVLAHGQGYAMDGHHIAPAQSKMVVVTDSARSFCKTQKVILPLGHTSATTSVPGQATRALPDVMLDLSVTNFVAYQWIAIVIMTLIFAVVRGRYKRNPLGAPRGIQNVIESVVQYVHDQIVRPNVGTDKRAMRLMPFMLSLFFFILTLNLVSLLPGAHATTGALPVTMALATCTLLVVNYIALKDAGVGSWFKHLLGGAPVYIAPIMVPIELVGIVTKPFALMIRLFANMTAGHIVLLSLVGLIFFFAQSMGESVGIGVAPISVLFSVFIYLLELLVAFLQAYIFTMLSAVFVGLALGDHAAHDHHHEHVSSH